MEHKSDSPADQQSRQTRAVRGRGATLSPVGRFEALEAVADEHAEPDPSPDREPTLYLKDGSKSVISRNQSPDVPFDISLNPYRGCEHGCSYCYARPTHEYLGFSAGLDFETRIMVKENAAALLRRELEKPRWEVKTLAMSGVTDPYQPIERKLQITRACLEVLVETRHPVGLITKNPMIARDVDLLGEAARFNTASAALSITTLDPDLSAKMEPRAGHPRRRLDAVAKLRDAGVPVGVMVAPVIPGLNDHELPSIVGAAADAGAQFVGYIMLRLPGAVEPIFSAWLEDHFPDRREKILNRLRSMRDGQLTDGRFGSRMRGKGAFADQVRSMFELARRKHRLDHKREPLSTTAFRRPKEQLRLF